MSEPIPLPRKLEKLRQKAAEARDREAAARAEAEELERRLHKRAAKAGIELGGAAPAGKEGGRPPLRGVAAIRAVVDAEPERIWSAAAIQEKLEAKGWVSPDAVHRRQGIEAAISRLVRGGELRRVERGRYLLAGQIDAPS